MRATADPTHDSTAETSTVNVAGDGIPPDWRALWRDWRAMGDDDQRRADAYWARYAPAERVAMASAASGSRQHLAATVRALGFSSPADYFATVAPGTQPAVAGRDGIPDDGLPDLENVALMTPPETLDDEYVCGFMRPGKLILIASSEGIGKSYIRKELEHRLASGIGALFGRYPITRPVRVGTVDEENGPDEEWRRDEEMLPALGITRRDLGDRYRRGSFLGLNLTDQRTQDYLRRQVAGLDVLFLDTGGAMVDEEYGAPLRGAVRFLRSLIRERPTLTIVLMVHMVKPVRDAKATTSKRRPLSDVMGQWTRQADVVAVLTDLGADRYRWELMKRRGVPRSAGIVDYAAGLTAWVADVDDAGEPASTGDTIHVLRAIAAGGTDWKAICTGTKLTKDRVFAAVRNLRGDGLIDAGTPYRLTPDGWEAIG